MRSTKIRRRLLFSKPNIALLVGAALALGQSPTAFLTSLNPNSAPQGSPATPLSINGQNLASGSTVQWTAVNGIKVTLNPQLVQSAQLSATIPASLLTTAGTAQVAVANPAGVLTNQLPFNISIGSIAVTAMALPSGSPGVAYGPVTLAATGGTGSVTWVLSGVLPAGLGLDSTGVLSGTPVSPGTYSFSVRVTDTSGAKALGTFSLTVNPSPLKLTTPATLPAGIAGFDYPAQILSATGGTAPYTFGMTGPLPSGLAFANGAISGTPTSAGATNFTLTVTDSGSPAQSASSATQLTIRPATTDLVLGGSSASFSLTTGSTGLPSAIVIPVSSSTTVNPIGYTATMNPAVTWLTETTGSTTPGSVTIALAQPALSLAASNTPYQTSVVLTCAAGTPCAGNTQTIGVSLTVTSPDPELSATPALLSFMGNTASPPSPEALEIQNIGGGSLNITSISAADKWVTVGAYPASIAPGPPTAVTISVNPAGFNPGFYLSSVNVVTSSGNASIPVTLAVAASSMTLNPAGMQFNMAAGGALGNPAGSFAVSFAGNAAAFTASVLPGAPWLSVTSQTANSIGYAISPSMATALAAGSYYGTIRVTATGVVNSPQDFEVILTVAPAASPTLPDPEPAGLLFISNGTTAPPSQSLKLYASSASSVPYEAAAITSDGHQWLFVTPLTGSASASTPGSPTISVNPSGLSAGIYRGGVTYEYNGASLRTVNVTLIVQPSYTASTKDGGEQPLARPAATSCTPSQLAPSPIGPPNNFGSPVGWPSLISINLVDNCGSAITNAVVTASFSSENSVLPLKAAPASPGLYAATWAPQKASSQVTITATATAPGFASAQAVISGQVKPNLAPMISPNSVLQIFDPLVGGALAPGNVIQLYGSGLGSQISQPSLPLPTSAAGTSVIIGGISAPLFYVSPGQIDAQIPYNLPAGMPQVIVSVNGAFSTPMPITVNAVAPGVLPYPNTTELVALRVDGSLVSDSSPAQPGENLFFFLAGMGVTDNSAVTSGGAAPGLNAGDMLAHPQVAPTLTIDGTPVSVAFSGLTPGLVGLYQINFQLPVTTQNGYSEVILTQGGTASNSTLLPVHN